MKEQFLDLTGLTDVIKYLQICITQHKSIIPLASFSVFPKVGDENNIYIDTSNNNLYRWDGTNSKYVQVAKADQKIILSSGAANGQVSITVNGEKQSASVYGLKSAAYTESTDYASAAQGAKADSAIQTITISSGTNNGTVKVTVNGVTTDNIKVTGLGSAAFSDIGVFAPKSHTHIKSEVGLGSVDNTADKDKSVKFASSAGSVDWENVQNKPTSYTPTSHSHDDKYYTKGQVDSKLGGKSDTGHTHSQFTQETKFSNDTFTDPLPNTSVAIKASGGIATDLIYEGGSTLSSKYQPKGSYAASSHTHDDRYYTENEIDSKLSGKANSSHTHTKDQVGLGNVDNTADSAKSVNYANSAGTASSVADSGEATADIARHVWFSNTDPESKRVYSENFKYNPATNVLTVGSITGSASSAVSVQWSGVQNKPTSYTPSAHTHSKSQITDFPSSLPASDVYAWAKASSKPSYSKSEIGLGNVDNTADSAKSVNYANSAGSASIASKLSNAGHLDTVDKLNAFLEANAFKYATVAGLSNLNGLDNNDGIILSACWNSGTNYGHQIYLDDNSALAAHRGKNNGTWTSWAKFLDSNNYTSYTVTKTGSGASGTWSINVTGSSGSCTGNAATASNASKVNGHTVNSDVPSGAVFTDTDTWRGIQDNLTSSSTGDSLSANQGRILKGYVDSLSAGITKAEIDALFA